jgi:hypothetical protein
MLKNGDSPYTSLFLAESDHQHQYNAPYTTSPILCEIHNSLPTTYHQVMKCNSIRYFTNQPTIHNSTYLKVQIQVDGGANRSITNIKEHLICYTDIASYPIYGVAKDEAAVQCVGMGYTPWQSSTGKTLNIPTLYSPQVSETIISPTDVVLSHINTYNSWAQFAHVDTSQGNITFFKRDSTHHTVFDLYMENGLWYHNNPLPPNHIMRTPDPPKLYKPC